MSEDIHFLTAAELALKIRQKQLSPVEISALAKQTR